jgi:hypothetical protein
MLISHDLSANAQDHGTVASDDGLECLFPGLLSITHEPIEQLTIAESRTGIPTEDGLKILVKSPHSSECHWQHLLGLKSRPIM